MQPEEVVVNVPGVQGGEPIVRGTRTPVRTIASLYHPTYAGDITEACRSLPHSTSGRINAALAYYDAQREGIDALTVEHEQALRDFIAAHERAASEPLHRRRCRS